MVCVGLIKLCIKIWVLSVSEFAIMYFCQIQKQMGGGKKKNHKKYINIAFYIGTLFISESVLFCFLLLCSTS